MISNQPKFLSRFREHLLSGNFFKPGARILVACSGGPDSVALARSLAASAAQNRWRLGIVHFDHQLRPASRTDARFVRGIAKELKCPFYGGAGNVERRARRSRTSIEEAAREMRYDFFLRTAREKKYNALALAHTMDDQAETVLMRVLQGTGLRGLQGIRERARIGTVALARPFLAFTKREILEFLRAEKHVFRKDESNESPRFLRNRIRLKLLPALRRDFNPRVVESIARIPAIVKEENALLSALEKDAWKKALKRTGRGKAEIRHDVFMELPRPLQFRVLEKALKRVDPSSGISFEAWERVSGGLSKKRNRWSLPRNVDLVLTPKKIMVYKRTARDIQV